DNLSISANRVSSLGGGVGGNLILQANSTGLPSFIAGKVGIGTNTPDVKVHINGGTDLSGTSGGFLQIGLSSSTNIAFDNNEIQARDDSAVAKLTLQNDGGGLQVGS